MHCCAFTWFLSSVALSVIVGCIPFLVYLWIKQFPKERSKVFNQLTSLKRRQCVIACVGFLVTKKVNHKYHHSICFYGSVTQELC